MVLDIDHFKMNSHFYARISRSKEMSQIRRCRKVLSHDSIYQLFKLLNLPKLPQKERIFKKSQTA